MTPTDPSPDAARASTLVIPERFCGPPGTGNGGYVGGWLAAWTGCAGPVEVTLRRPAPLGTPLRASRAEEGGEASWTLAGAEGAVAQARPSPPLPRVEPPACGSARRRSAGAARSDHPFPHCFVCGPARALGDGLRLAPEPVAGADGVVAAPWEAPADLADVSGALAPAVVWAALDCPGYFACMGGGPLAPLLLGRMTAAIEGPVRAGERYEIVAWPLGRAGRRYEAATALLDAGGRAIARATQVWVAPRAAGAD